MPVAEANTIVAAALGYKQRRIAPAVIVLKLVASETAGTRSIATLSPISSVGALVAASRKPQWIQGTQRLPAV